MARTKIIGGQRIQFTQEEEAARDAEEAQVVIDNQANGYKRKRAEEYPNTIECIHALLDGGDTLTDLQAQRTAIKNKYPKG